MANTAAPINHQAEKDRSYNVRRAIGVPEGQDGSGFAVALRDLLAYGEVVITAGTRCRVTTSNAGFRGIECTAVDEDGNKVHGVSLGAFRAVAVR